MFTNEENYATEEKKKATKHAVTKKQIIAFAQTIPQFLLRLIFFMDTGSRMYLAFIR